MQIRFKQLRRLNGLEDSRNNENVWVLKTGYLAAHFLTLLAFSILLGKSTYFTVNTRRSLQTSSVKHITCTEGIEETIFVNCFFSCKGCMPHLRSSEFRSTCLRCLESTFFSKASLKITVNTIKHCTFKRQGNEDQRLSVSPTWSRPAHVRYPSWFHAFPAHDWENEISKVSLSLWISDWSEGKWEIKISSTWSWIWLIPSPFYCQTWLVASRLRVTRTAGAGGDGKGEERSLQHPSFPPSHHTQTRDELTARLSYYEMSCHNYFCICAQNLVALFQTREGLGASLFIMG